MDTLSTSSIGVHPHIGFPNLWMHSAGVYRSFARRVSPRARLMPSRSLLIDGAPVMDMLAVLYIYLLELNKGIEHSTLSHGVARVDRDKVKLLEMFQNKVLAVRCISYMFSVFRCVMVIR